MGRHSREAPSRGDSERGRPTLTWRKQVLHVSVGVVQRGRADVGRSRSGPLPRGLTYVAAPLAMNRR